MFQQTIGIGRLRWGGEDVRRECAHQLPCRHTNQLSQCIANIFAGSHHTRNAAIQLANAARQFLQINPIGEVVHAVDLLCAHCTTTHTHTRGTPRFIFLILFSKFRSILFETIGQHYVCS